MVHDLFWAISDLGIEGSSVMRVIDGSSISDSFLEIMVVHLFRWACVLIVLQLSKAERKVAVSISSQLFIDSTSVVTRWFDGLLLFVEAESDTAAIDDPHNRTAFYAQVTDGPEKEMDNDPREAQSNSNTERYPG